MAEFCRIGNVPTASYSFPLKVQPRIQKVTVESPSGEVINGYIFDSPHLRHIVCQSRNSTFLWRTLLRANICSYIWNILAKKMQSVPFSFCLTTFFPIPFSCPLFMCSALLFEKYPTCHFSGI